MNQTTISLNQLINSVEEHLAFSGYSNSTIQRYRSVWNKLLKKCEVGSIELFSHELCLKIITEVYHIPSENLKQHHVFYTRAVKILNDYNKYGKISKCHQKPGLKVDPEFAGPLSMFTNKLYESNLSTKTIQGKSIHLTRFLNYVSQKGIKEIDQLSVECVLSYIDSFVEKGYSRSTRSGILFTLRSFLTYLYQSKYVSTPIHQLFTVIFSNKMERIPSFYTEDELQRILLHVNRDADIGKRDYLILLFAIQLGIRAGDIRMMRVENIQWGKNTIEFIQQKTRNPIQLPLPESIKYALIDYLKNGRPKSDSPYIFLRHRAPLEPYASQNAFHYVITRYMKEAGICYSTRKHGLHSMRHSLASNLLKNNAPYPIITGVLGHENTNTTRLYLSIDLDQLRSVALEVPYEI